jgi:hypothetical protein
MKNHQFENTSHGAKHARARPATHPPTVLRNFSRGEPFKISPRANETRLFKEKTMKHLIALAAVAMTVAALPASAQTADGKTMKPSMDQCKGGYMSSYKTSMMMSKSKFKSACAKMMSDDKMMKQKTTKDKM